MTDQQHPNRQLADQTALDDLVLAARSDRAAFGKLFDEFHPVIFAYCLRRLILRAVAEDVTAEVFLKVAGNIRGFLGTTAEDFRRWAFRIAINEINGHLRQTIRRRELLEAAVQMGRINAAVTAPLLDDSSALEWETLYRALGDLTDREQSIISLRFFAGLKHDQISEVLELKAGAVRVGLSRALKKLRQRLRDQDHCKPLSPVSKDRGR